MTLNLHNVFCQVYFNKIFKTEISSLGFVSFSTLSLVNLIYYHISVILCHENKLLTLAFNTDSCSFHIGLRVYPPIHIHMYKGQLKCQFPKHMPGGYFFFNLSKYHYTFIAVFLFPKSLLFYCTFNYTIISR